MAVYVFDSNVFMDLQRRQPLDLYPSVWERIGALMEEGIIISSREVYEEIQAGNDELAEWVKVRENSFIPSEESIQLIVREILVDYRAMVEGGKKKNTADPFVIAVAKTNHCKVVTSESPAGAQQPPKIPNVCSAMNIECLSFVAFQREMKFAF